MPSFSPTAALSASTLLSSDCAAHFLSSYSWRRLLPSSTRASRSSATRLSRERELTKTLVELMKPAGWLLGTRYSPAGVGWASSLCFIEG